MSEVTSSTAAPVATNTTLESKATLEEKMLAAVELRNTVNAEGECENTAESLQILEGLLQKAVEEYGEKGHKCAPFYYEYGTTLLLRAEEAANLFGETMSDKAKQRDEVKKLAALVEAKAKEAEATKAVEDAKKAEDSAEGDAKIKASAVHAAALETAAAASEIVKNATAPVEEEQASEEDPNELLEIAWECLEMARIIYEESSVPADLLALARVHTRIGDLCLEVSNFDQAIESYLETIKIRRKSLEPSDRLLADSEFNCGSAYFYAKKHKQALNHYKNAGGVILCKLRKIISENEGKLEVYGLSAVTEDSTETVAVLTDSAEKGKGKGKRSISEVNTDASTSAVKQSHPVTIALKELKKPTPDAPEWKKTAYELCVTFSLIQDKVASQHEALEIDRMRSELEQKTQREGQENPCVNLNVEPQKVAVKSLTAQSASTVAAPPSAVFSKVSNENAAVTMMQPRKKAKKSEEQGAE